MESKYKLKLICGFRQDQEYTIDANEAHKAYYLFNNPELRGTFDNGLAIKGSDIQRIVPDYHSTMGWNPTHRLDGDDMNVLRAEGVVDKIQEIMSKAKEVAHLARAEDMTTPLLTLVRGKYAQLSAGSEYAQKVLESKNS